MKDKFEPRSFPCIFMGYSDKHKGYRCLYISTGRVYISRHVVFDEMKFLFNASSIRSIGPLASVELQHWITHHSLPTSTVPLSLDKNHARLCIQEVVLSFNGIPEAPTINANSQPPTTRTHHMITRSRAGLIKPNPKYELVTLQSSIHCEPKTFKSALKHTGWYRAVLEEMKALHDNKTWVLVPRPPHMNIIGCKWDYKMKRNADGSLDQLKAQFVMKGYNQWGRC